MSGLISQPVGAIVASAGIINPLDAILQVFNTNPYFIGLMMLFLNLGGRFLGMEISKQQEQFFQHTWVRRFLIFTVLFVATRNLMVAFWLTVFVIIMLGYVFNENSALCIFGQSGMSGSTCGGKSDTPSMTPEEQEIFRRLSEKQYRIQSAIDKSNKTKNTTDKITNNGYLSVLQKGEADKQQIDDDDEDITKMPTEVYITNMSVMRNLF
jgi:hypothetical protein